MKQYKNFERNSTVQEIRDRFDVDVERFSNLETGQTASIDSPVHLDLLTEAAARTTPEAKSVLDIGCGAGNYTLKLLQHLPDLNVTLLDLCQPMLDAAARRTGAVTSGTVTTLQSDIRKANLGHEQFDIVLAAQCLHHLRGQEEWRTVFEKIYSAIRPGGSLWISDSLTCESQEITDMMWQRHGEYLVEFAKSKAAKDKIDWQQHDDELAVAEGEAYRDKVFAYIEKEDTPQTLVFQLNLLGQVGFQQVDVLHMHNRFASFGGRKM